MPRKTVRINLSDSIVQWVANETMKRLGWSNQPELMQRETPTMLECGNNNVRFLVEYPLHKIPGFVYRIHVSLVGNEGSWWYGHVYAQHGSVKNVYWHAEFSVIDRPAEEVSEFENEIVVELGAFVSGLVKDGSGTIEIFDKHHSRWNK